MYRRRFVRRPRRKIVRRRAAKRTAVSSRIKKYVKRELHRNAENKAKIDYGANNAVLIAQPSSCTRGLIIGASQGNDAQTRSGNQIKITKGILRAVFNLLPYNGTSNPAPLPVWVKLWVVRDLRVSGQLSTMDSTDWGKFLRVGNQAVGFQYNPLDMCMDVNKDLFRVCWSKTFKLGCASGLFTTNVPMNSSSYFDNSPMAKQITINWGKFCKKQLKFDDNNSALPANDNLYLVIQACGADGTSTSTNQALIEYHFTNIQEFEDF